MQNHACMHAWCSIFVKGGSLKDARASGYDRFFWGDDINVYIQLAKRKTQQQAIGIAATIMKPRWRCGQLSANQIKLRFVPVNF